MGKAPARIHSRLTRLLTTDNAVSHFSIHVRSTSAVIGFAMFLFAIGCAETDLGNNMSAAPTATETQTTPSQTKTKPTPTSSPTTKAAVTVEPNTPTPQETSTSAISPSPTSTNPPPAPTATPMPLSTPTPIPTPPPAHFLTQEEVEAALPDLNCSGWVQVPIGDITYYRACAADPDYEISVMGAPSNLSGGLCNIDSDPTVRFTAAPTDLSLIKVIVPPGSPSGGTIAGHSYLHSKAGADDETIRIPVYAPADSILSSMSYYISNGGDKNFYFLTFDMSCEISYKFDHLVELAPTIDEVAPGTAVESSATNSVDPPITFEAGELIGYTDGGTWDFGAFDTTHVNQFANQERYSRTRFSQAVHEICPYDYYDDSLKSQFYALFGNPGGDRVAVSDCSPAKDVLGSAAGQWFDSPDVESGQSMLGIAMQPGGIVEISSESSNMRVYPGNPTWLDLEQLTTAHCYASDGQWTYIEINTDGLQMQLANGDGDCPSTLPTDAVTYYR